MSAAVVETAVRSLVRAEGEEVRRWLDREFFPGQLNRNDPIPLAPFSIPASARRFVPAGTYLLRTLADGLGSALDAPRYAGTGVLRRRTAQRDYATLAAAIPAIGAPVSVVGAPEHAALFEGVAGVSFEADLDAKAFLRAMAAARVVVIPWSRPGYDRRPPDHRRGAVDGQARGRERRAGYHRARSRRQRPPRATRAARRARTGGPLAPRRRRTGRAARQDAPPSARAGGIRGSADGSRGICAARVAFSGRPQAVAIDAASAVLGPRALGPRRSVASARRNP